MTELYHFGIKGQRWGVRRFQSPDGTLTAAGKARYKAYKKDFKSYDKLNRHVSASQRHLREEGVMLDRVRDKYLKENKNYQKEMRKSSGLFGLKGADKAERVARAQSSMDKVSKDYETAAGAYGLAKKIASQDSKALRDHVNKMIRSYGKGSINDLKTETVKIGQNKLQKLLQGAPTSVLLNKGRETEEFIKTGKTLADLPIIGNIYTSNYIANREMDIMRSRVENAEKSAKRGKGKDEPAYLKNPNYFDDSSSLTSTRKAERKQEKITEKENAKREKLERDVKEAESNYKKAESEWNKNQATKARAHENLQKAEANYEVGKRLKESFKGKYSPTGALITGHPVKAAKRAVGKAASNAYASATKRTYNKRSKQYTSIVKSTAKDTKKLASAYDKIGEAQDRLADYEVEALYKKNKKKRSMRHSYSVIKSDELYHHGIKGQRWGVRRYQNPDGTLTAKGKKRKEKLYAKAEKEYEKGINSKYLNKIDPHNSEFQKKLLALKKKEIDEGFNYMENRIKRNVLVGALLGGIPGAAATTFYTAIRYHKQDVARQNLMSNERQLEAAKQDAFDRMNRWQREINTQNMYRQMEFNNWQTSNMYTYHF